MEAERNKVCGYGGRGYGGGGYDKGGGDSGGGNGGSADPRPVPGEIMRSSGFQRRRKIPKGFGMKKVLT